MFPLCPTKNVLSWRAEVRHTNKALFCIYQAYSVQSDCSGQHWHILFIMHPLNDWVVNWRRIFIYECQCCVLVLFNFDCQHSRKHLRNYNILKFCTLRLFHRPKKKKHSIKCTYVFQNLDYAYSACKHAAAIRI